MYIYIYIYSYIYIYIHIIITIIIMIIIITSRDRRRAGCGTERSGMRFATPPPLPSRDLRFQERDPARRRARNRNRPVTRQLRQPGLSTARSSTATRRVGRGK